jgi:hypothetical protein
MEEKMKKFPLEFSMPRRAAFFLHKVLTKIYPSFCCEPLNCAPVRFFKRVTLESYAVFFGGACIRLRSLCRI